MAEVKELKKPAVMNPVGNTVVWARLEANRLQRLNIPNRRSTHVERMVKAIQARENPDPVPVIVLQNKPKEKLHCAMAASLTQSLAPFTTSGVATCGSYFSRSTDHTKKNFGIPPSDLVKWRSKTGSKGKQN